MQRNNEQISEFKEKLVAVNRVSKTVKGGRNMRFSALMVVGDEKGRVGCGMGKAAEIPEAIRKGLDAAKKEMRTIPISGTTIPHEVTGVFGTGKVKLLPAPEGTGVIAGGPVRAVLEAAGIKDIVTRLRSRASSSFAAPRKSPACAARPWKRSWVKEVSEHEAENHPDPLHHRLPQGPDRHDQGPGPAQDRPHGRQKR